MREPLRDTFFSIGCRLYKLYYDVRTSPWALFWWNVNPETHAVMRREPVTTWEPRSSCWNRLKFLCACVVCLPGVDKVVTTGLMGISNSLVENWGWLTNLTFLLSITWCIALIPVQCSVCNISSREIVIIESIRLFLEIFDYGFVRIFKSSRPRLWKMLQQ